MRDHERLHWHRVLLEQIRNARARIDDDLVGKAHAATLVCLFRGEEAFSEGPVVVADRHAVGRISVHHLFGADDLDLIRKGIKPVSLGDAGDFGRSAELSHNYPNVFYTFWNFNFH